MAASNATRRVQLFIDRGRVPRLPLRPEPPVEGCVPAADHRSHRAVDQLPDLEGERALELVGRLLAGA